MTSTRKKGPKKVAALLPQSPGAVARAEDVTRFAVREELIARYPVQQVGARIHTEHWIPAEDLAELNRNIVGLIEVIATFEPKETP